MVYILHFNLPIAHAVHYIGYCEDLEARLKVHKKGEGARLLSVMRDRGIGWRLANVIDGDRAIEKRIKSNTHSRRWCPICRHGDGERTYKVGFGREGRRGLFLPVSMMPLAVPFFEKKNNYSYLRWHRLAVDYAERLSVGPVTGSVGLVVSYKKMTLTKQKAK